MKWLLIETAPKVSSPFVDLWHSYHGRITDASFRKGCWCYWDSDGFEGMGWRAIKDQSAITHWMPLHDPPEAE